ncbi:MAG: FGGY-family carbohydrate kinase [Chloroflexota bacterium]|nr:FGGY-family carbohydrate kinase [Chloroflexota bacterium]
MSNSDLLLGIDVGTTGTKACLFTPDGALVASGQAEYPLHHLRPGWVEQDPHDWWRATCTAVHAALAQTPDAAARIIGIAVSGQAPSLIAVDEQGAPLRPALIWMDRRADAQVAALNEQFSADDIYRVTGNRCDGYYVAPKLRWLRDHEPETLRSAHRLLLVTGFINHRLTGEFSMDTVHVRLLSLYDRRTGEWWEAMGDACGVRHEQFPTAQPGHAPLGVVTRMAAEATGLRRGTPVFVGTVDGAAAALEAGAVRDGIVAEMTGTSSVLLMASQHIATDPALISMPHAAPNLHLLLGAISTSGAALRWFRDTFGQVEQTTAELLHSDAFDLLTQQAARVPAGSDGLLFLPYLAGERSPIWDSHARGVFFGISLATPRAAFIRAILEGTAFALRHNIEVARTAGMTVREIRAVGGGARSALWSQIKADVLGLPVALPEASIGAPFGDALLVGLGSGIYSDLATTVQQIVRIRAVYEPDAERHAHYSKFYALYRDLYTHLRNDFATAARVFSS